MYPINFLTTQSKNGKFVIMYFFSYYIVYLEPEMENESLLDFTPSKQSGHTETHTTSSIYIAYSRASLAIITN